MRKALYRAYRPQTFDAVLGQDTIVQVLKNQVISGRLGHAYLFSGTRGTGKTSCAKILSRAVNCLHPVDGNPCNACENCLAILEETTMDVVEMDAASNRRIDDIRELRDKVIYPPTQLKYKVYIIDEAHMITNEGFNALLKIMEEPPSHLIFILATTEIEKLPQTILSRVQRYEFRRMGIEDIESNINVILKDYAVDMEEEAKILIARTADGAMRDALSILDQTFSIGKDYLTVQDVRGVIGTAGRDRVIDLVQAVADRDFIGALDLLTETITEGKDIQVFAKEVAQYFRLLMRIRVLGAKGAPDMDPEAFARARTLADHFTAQELADGLGTLVNQIERMRRSDMPEILMELCLEDLCSRIDRESLLSRLSAVERKLEMLEKEGLQVKPKAQKAPEPSYEPAESVWQGPVDPFSSQTEKTRPLEGEDQSSASRPDSEPRDQVQESLSLSPKNDKDPVQDPPPLDTSLGARSETSLEALEAIRAKMLAINSIGKSPQEPLSEDSPRQRPVAQSRKEDEEVKSKEETIAKLQAFFGDTLIII